MKKFKTESKRMLDLMINSIYTNREIFLRELLSNCSDAIDKLYYKSLTEGVTGLTRGDFAIRITVDKDKRTLTVSDNGVGMTEEELENNLGTIAKSGSYAFKTEELENKDDIDIIGQFGVGFYSSFMVAKKVEVISKAFGSDKAFKWESEGADGYDVTPCEKDAVGTDVILYLKDDTDDEKYGEYLTEYKIKDLVKKYSDYIRYPIKMTVTDYEYEDDGCDCDDPDHEHEHKHKEPKEVRKEATLNSMVPVWKKSQSELKEGELEQFYKDTYYDQKDPL
ncbi:MAG: ATP-binding protein, partial [Clostridia bacterium]|nr:ATP-binding protein [Clostridia bacterium]